MLSGLGPGVNLMVLALVLLIIVLVIVALNRYSNQPSESIVAESSNHPSVNSGQSEAIVIVRTGGRIEYVNDLAHSWFELRPNELPTMDRISRRVRPSDDFYTLSAVPGQKRITVGNRLVEATSYQVPGAYLQTLIVMKPVEIARDSGGETTGDSSILHLISDFGRDVTASLQLDTVLRAVLLNISQLIPSDLLEIKTRDPQSQQLTSYVLEDLGDSGIQKMSKSQFGGLADYLLEKRNPVLVSDFRTPPQAIASINGNLPIQSYLGMPLIADEELVGTLELGNLTPDALSEQDLNMLQLFLPQIAYSLRNAIEFDNKITRETELTRLVGLSTALSGARDLSTLIQKLINNIAPLFSVDILGFLIFDEGKRTLEAHHPFQGLPPQIVDVYKTTIDAGTQAEKIVLGKKTLVSLSATASKEIADLGLETFAQAASLRETILAPIVATDHLIGYFQISNHKRSSFEFSFSEIRLAESIAQQLAGILENSVNFEETRKRALRSDALRRIASLAASPATINEILRFSVQELVRLFQGDFAALYLYDERIGKMELHEDSVFGILSGDYSSIHFPHLDVSQYRNTVSGSRQPFLSGRLSLDRELFDGYRLLTSSLQIESVVIVPVVSRDQTLGELIIGSRKAELFNNFDMQIISTAASQLGTAIEDASRSNLTDEILHKQVEQLTAITRVGRELNSMRDVRSLLEVVHSESIKTTGADCGNIVLLDDSITDQPTASLSIGCPRADGFSALELHCIMRAESKVIGDLENTNDLSAHEGVNSVLINPILNEGKTTGLILLHSTQTDFFDESSVELIQALSSQAAVAIGNAKRYKELSENANLLQRRAETLNKLAAADFSINIEVPLEQTLRSLAANIREAISFNMVLISVYEADTGMFRRVAGVGIPQETLSEAMARKQPLSGLKQIFKPEFRISHSYFVPADKSPILPSDVHAMTVDQDIRASSNPNAWDPDDSLVTILEDYEGNPLGLISVDSPRNGLRPDRTAIDTLEIFSSQATLAIMGTTLVTQLRSKVETLSSGIERQQRLLEISQSDLPILLRKDLDQTIAIQNLDQRSQRVRAGLAITESVSRQLDASSALQALARETLTQLGMSIAMIAEDSSDGPRLTHVLGNIPRATSPDALFGQKNPLRTCLQTGEAILISALDENLDWRETPLLTALRAKSLICLPIKIDKRPVAAMLAISLEPMPPFTDEDLQVYFQIVRQTSVILQNISLLNETRQRLQEVNLLLDFSRQLRGLDSDRIVKSLLESARKAILAAHAGMVLLWNEHTDQLEPQAVSGYADNQSMFRIPYASGESLPGQVYESNQPLRVDELQFARDYTFSSEAQLLYRQATGGRLPVSSLLIPIQSGDQRVGVLVLDNFNTSSAFTVEDETLLLSLAQQVGLSLQNVRLVQATQERAKQLEALTTASTHLTSSLKSTELIESLIDQVQPVIPHDTATLWMREGDKLTVSATRGFPDTEQRLGLVLAVNDSALFKEMIKTGQGIVVGDVRDDPRFPTLEAPRLSWLGLPLVSKNEVVGVLALEKWQAYFYTREHIQVGTTFASQSAIALENARLFEDSTSRASELDERSQRLALLNRFSSSLSGLLDDEEKIFQVTAQELQDALGAPRTSVVTFERGQPVWIYSNPKPRFKLPKDLPTAPIFSRLNESLGVFTTHDVSLESDLDPILEFLDKKTKALLVLPLVTGGSTLGALIFIHQYTSIRFNPSEVELARTLANQAAIALENARLYKSARITADRLAILNQASYQVSSSLDPEEIYISVHEAVKKLMPVESFVINLLDEETDEIEGVYLVDGDYRAETVKLPRDKGLSGRVINSGEPLLIQGTSDGEGLDAFPSTKSQAPQSILAVPMMLGNRSIGMLSAQSYQKNVYAEDDLQLLSTLANQAIVAIQNGRLFNETQRLAQELEQRVIDRTAELQREQQNTETLLRILTEVSSSLDLDRALNRTLALLNDAIGAEQGTIMLRSAEDNMLHYRAGYGYLSERITGEERGFTLKIGEGLAGWVVAHREAVLVHDLQQDDRWVVSGSSSSEHRSAIVVPLLVAEDVIGVLMVFHRKDSFFSGERLNMVKAIAGQVSVAINNAHLYELIRDQAERLGSMLRREQEDASRSQAILEAVADGVLVTGTNNRITFLNNSAEKIMALKSTEIINQALDVFAGLFGNAAGSWMETIRMWSSEPSKYQAGETYAEQLDLENGRIVLVHLAPVILENDFLGTVSIFRDITHEVEVDRLKSEFVATVSHELRTPMTSIRGYTDVLLMGAAGAMNENQTHFLNIIKNNTERLNVLVNDLLDVSQIESGRVTLSRQALDLRQIAEEILGDVLRRSQEENKPMALSLDAPKRLPLVHGDSERVRQILSNIVFNAYHYTPENGTITVHLHPVDADREVQVDVIDNGVGIVLEDQSRIFERFYRGEHPLVLATPGTGLGLSIVKEIVEMHKGRIWMKSSGNVGEGSTFSFTLPVYEKNEA